MNKSKRTTHVKFEEQLKKRIQQNKQLNNEFNQKILNENYINQNNNAALKNIEHRLKSKVSKKIINYLKRGVYKSNRLNPRLLKSKVNTMKNMYKANQIQKQNLIKKMKSGVQLSEMEYALLVKLQKYDEHKTINL